MILGHIGVSCRHQLLAERLHLLDMLGGAGFHCRPQRAERVDRGVEPRRGTLGQFADGDTALEGALVDLVVEVRDVPGIGDMASP